MALCGRGLILPEWFSTDTVGGACCPQCGGRSVDCDAEESEGRSEDGRCVVEETLCWRGLAVVF